MTLEEFQANEQLVAEYKKFTNSDLAACIRSVCTEVFCRPGSAAGIDKSTAEYLYGENVGSWKTLDGVFGLDTLKIQEEEDPDATYGADEKINLDEEEKGAS